MAPLVDGLGRPGHHMSGPDGDQLVASGTSIRLLGVPAGNRAHVPVTVGPGFDGLTAEADTVFVEALRLGRTTMAARTHT